MADETVNISIQADIRALRDELAKMPNVGDKEARKLVNNLTKQYKAAEKAAKDAAKKSAQAWEKSLKATGDASKQALSLMGGAFGQIGQVAIELGGKLGAVAGPAGIAAAGIAALGIGAVAGAKALVGIAEAADAAAKRLVDAGRAAELPPGALESIEAYRVATADLRAELDRLTVVLGSDVAKEITGAIQLYFDVRDAVEAARAKVAEFTAGNELLADQLAVVQVQLRVVQALASFGSSEIAAGLRAYADSAEDAGEATDDFAVTTSDLRLVEGEAAAEAAYRAEVTDAVTAATEAAAKATRDYAGATSEAASADAEWVLGLGTVEQLEADLAAAHLARAEAAAEAGRIEAEAAAAAQAAEAERMAALAAEVEEFEALAAEVQESLAEGLDEWWQQQIDKLAEIGEAAVGTFNDIAGLIQTQNDLLIASAQEEIERREENLESWKEGELERIDQMLETGEISGKQAILERRRIREEAAERRRAMRQRTRDERQAAIDAFEANQAWAISATVINGIAAGVRAFAELGPIAGAITAAGLAATTAASIAQIEAQDPPSFEVGGMVTDRAGGRGTTPDHRTIQARDDEAVLTGRGVSTAGGRAGVERLNRGEAWAPVINLVVDGRTVASATINHLGDALLTPTPGSFAAGRRPLY
jgi:hypothetical protein